MQRHYGNYAIGTLNAPVAIQARLKVGAPDDRFEREADRVADRIMHMPLPDRPVRSGAPPGIQRKCAACAAGPAPCLDCGSVDEEIQRKPLAAARPQANSGPGRAGAIGPAARELVTSVNTGGQPLPAEQRSFFEPRLGVDLSAVRIHRDAPAAMAARSVGARAYTLGRDVVFGQGEYRPETPAGRHLLAHELTHVVQQGGGRRPADAPPSFGGGTDPGVARAPVGRIQRQDGDPIPVDLVPTSPEEVERLREQGIELPSVSPETWEAIGGATPVVYLCSIDLRTSPVGRHALFRIGAPGPGNETRSLQPFDQGGDCWQGIPLRNEPFDQSAAADCQATTISAACLEREFRAYPVGHYCTLGPNSNTFVGHLARSCGMANPDPTGWTPGIGDSPPPSGTFAPDKWATLTGCETKICLFERERRPDEPVPV